MTSSTTTENSNTTQAESAVQGQEMREGQVVHVEPSTLLLQRNIRTVKDDAEFTALVKSVKSIGVQVPITAVLTESGDLLVRMGERRTLAAIQAARETVPVYVSGTDATEDAAEVERIIAQRDENTHRVGLTTAEDLGVVGQLAAFGLSPNQIAKQARIKRSEVDTALTVLGSDLAKAATVRHENLTLDQAAVVAEFEDDTETVTALIAATRTGQFEHVAQRARNDRERTQARQRVAEALEASGVRVIDKPTHDSPTERLTYLVDAQAEVLDDTEHAKCPGHVAWLTEVWGWVDAEGNPLPEDFEPTYEDEDDFDGEDETQGGTVALQPVESEAVEPVDPYADAREALVWVPTYGCENPAEHGHQKRFAGPSGHGAPVKAEASEAEKEKARQERKTVIENNKAWDAAETVRRAWLPTLAARKTPPKGTGAFLATALTRDAHTVTESGGDKFAAEWLGVKESHFGRSDYTKVIAKATEARATVVALVQVLAAYEARTGRMDWRRDGDSPAGRYLRFLASVGYTLSDVEQIATGATKDA